MYFHTFVKNMKEYLVNLLPSFYHFNNFYKNINLYKYPQLV